jgi:hypothetical protein
MSDIFRHFVIAAHVDKHIIIVSMIHDDDLIRKYREARYGAWTTPPTQREPLLLVAVLSPRLLLLPSDFSLLFGMARPLSLLFQCNLLFILL